MDDDSNIVTRGRMRTVEYAVRKDGTVPAKTFFDLLDKRDKAYLLARFQILVNDGDHGIGNEGIFKREREYPKDIGIQGHLWAFKKKTYKRPGGGKGMIRIPCFLYQSRWILTHGFWKPPQSKWPEEQFTLAFQIIHEVIEREHKIRHLK
jgi:hypothetical protein